EGGETRVAWKNGDDVFGETVGEIFLVRLATHVFERENRDRGSVRRGQWPGRRVGRTATCGLDQGASICGDSRRQGTLGDVADEAKPAFVQGANQGLIIAVVVECAARRADA